MSEGWQQGKRVGRTLFARIGQFLDSQGLEPDPANYTLAYAAMSDPDGPLAQAILRLTDGGVRLGRRELEELGGKAAGAPPVGPSPAEEQAQALVAETQTQVDGFATLMRDMQAETRGVGRDLAERAAAMRAVAQGPRSADAIAEIAGAMVARLRDAEQRLAHATEETDALRAKLAEARDSARRDALTGLPNRRALEEAYANRDPAHGPHCFAVCDVDHFKRLNDGHGHPVGDRVLRAIAQTLAEECAGHLVVRFGGEEFAVLIAGLTVPAAGELLDRARAAVAAKRFRTRDTDAPIGTVTFSAGVTGIARGEDMAVPFDRADRLLYRAKEQGRNQVCTG